MATSTRADLVMSTSELALARGWSDELHRLLGRSLNDPRPDVVIKDGEVLSGLAGPRSLRDTIPVALGDGSVRTLNARKLSYRTWSLAVTPDDGMPLGEDW